MIKYSLTNCDSTIGENISYLMHRYKFDMHQWYGSTTPNLFNKIDLYITCYTVIEDMHWLAARELCNFRDGLIICPLPPITKL